MKRYSKLFALMVPLIAAAVVSNCILEEKIIDFVINEDVCGQFDEIHTTANYSNDAFIDYAQEIDDALTDNDLSRSQIQTARIVSGEYLVTSFSHTHDWTIEGSILVERDDIADGPDTLMQYSGVSLQNALGIPEPMPLHPDGVALLHRAIDDYLAGSRPQLIFSVRSGDVTPLPSVADTLKFEWEACLLSHVVVVDTVEIPDP